MGEIKNIYQSITSIMDEVPSIGKNKTNEQQRFKYRGIDDVMNAFQPLLAKHKVFIVPEVMEQTREERTSSRGGNLIYSICKIKFKFFAEDGSFIEAVTIGEGMDSGDKATNKAMAIAMKYAMFQVFCIPTEEMEDPDKTTPPNSKPKDKGTNQKQYNKPTPKPTPKAETPKIITKEEAMKLSISIAKYAEIKNGNDAELRNYYLNKYKVKSLEELNTVQKNEIEQKLNPVIKGANNGENN